MKTKHYLFTLLAALALATGCYNDDKLWKAVHEQQQRIEALEAWQKTANSNIEALQALVSGKHFITDVTPVVLAGDTTGYTIAFHNRTPVTIYDGTKGDKGDKGEPGATPAISLTQGEGEGGNWYWMLNGTLMKDANGSPIRANGKSAPTPVLNTGQTLTNAGTPGTWTADAVYLSVDAGKTWTQVSGSDGKDGDAVFAPDGVAVDKQAGYVTFTLADKFTTFRLPLYGATVIRFESNETLMVDLTDGARAFLLLPDGFPKSDYGALMAEVVAPSDGNSDIVTRSASNNWTVKLEPPVFHDNGNIDDPYVEITPPQDINLVGTKALLRVTLVHSNGYESTVSRVLLITNAILYDYTLEEQLTEPGTKPTMQDPDQPNSATNPYLIKSAEHLQWLKRNPKKNNYYKLTRDIEITGTDGEGNWVPIGRLDSHFAGSFDGGGKSISNLFVEISNYGGLFGVIKGGETAVLKNITLLSPQVKVGSGYCGALAGHCEYVTLENCYVKDGKCESDGAVVGALVGSFNYSTVLNCHAEGMEVTGFSDVGGLIGFANTKESNEIKKCSVTKCVVTGTGDRGHGGLIGTFSMHKLKLKGCYTTGSITSLHGPVGALVGEEMGDGGIPSDIYVEMTGCYSTMTIESNSYEDSELTLMCKGLHSWKYTDCYYITPHVGQTPTSGLTYYPIITSDMINAMNAALGSEIYKEDGTFK